MKNGLFITFEGIEGSGKSTQIQLLKEYLEKNLQKKIYLFREPGSTDFGEKLREAILESTQKLHPLSEAYLFASSRSQLLFEKVHKLLEDENNVVMFDRYIDSSTAYQGFARGLGPDTIEKIHSVPPLDIRPDITFYLKISLEESMSRQSSRGQEKDYFEKEKENFYMKLIEGYDYCAQRFTNRIITINSGNIEQVHQQIINGIKKIYD